MLPNLSLIIEFLGNVFTNFILEKLSRMKPGDGKSYNYSYQ